MKERSESLSDANTSASKRISGGGETEHPLENQLGNAVALFDSPRHRG